MSRPERAEWEINWAVAIGLGLIAWAIIGVIAFGSYLLWVGLGL